MIVVAFLLPLALYLFALSWVNRQPRPFVVAGTWDFVGLLFAASGFLLVGGPAVLSSFNERWRRMWILAETSSLPEGLEAYQELWLLLAVGYFVVVVGVSARVLMRRRRLTCIYNVEPSDVENVLEAIFAKLGLDPIRSGGVYVFCFALDAEGRVPTQSQSGAQNVILEMDSFQALRHVSLRWDPHDSPLRVGVEAELRQRLEQLAAPDHDAAVWFNFAGTAMLIGSVFIVAFLIARLWFLRT